MHIISDCSTAERARANLSTCSQHPASYSHLETSRPCHKSSDLSPHHEARSLVWSTLSDLGSAGLLAAEKAPPVADGSRPHHPVAVASELLSHARSGTREGQLRWCQGQTLKSAPADPTHAHASKRARPLSSHAASYLDLTAQGDSAVAREQLRGGNHRA